MRDLFNGAHYSGAKSEIDLFRWVVAIFSGDGAVQIIKRANEKELKTFYPRRKNFKGEYVPLWRHYLFIEFVEGVTIDLCRTTSSFSKVISERDEDGLVRPILVRKDGINESLQLMKQGKLDDVITKRQFRGKGAIVRVIDGVFHDRSARLEMDIFPEMSGNQKVRLDINGLKIVVELYKLDI